MDTDLSQQLKFLGLKLLQQQREEYLNRAVKKKSSYISFLSEIIRDEYEYKIENRRKNRLKEARIPEKLVMETFPFARQPRLKKKIVMQLYDSMEYMNKNQVMLFIGPTGCGKTGLATAFLIHAINNGSRGLFIDFKDMIRMLQQAAADHSQQRVIKRLSAVDCLLIDEMGYEPLLERQAGLFFDVVKQRHKNKCTIITTQLGFEEWNVFINNTHLTAALIDRITENCTVFNMNTCISIREKKIVYAADKSP